MKRNYTGRIVTTIAAVLLALWAISSLTLQALSLAHGPVHLSFRFYSNVTPEPSPGDSYEFQELPAWGSVGILLSVAVAATLWLRSSRRRNPTY